MNCLISYVVFSLLVMGTSSGSPYYPRLDDEADERSLRRSYGVDEDILGPDTIISESDGNDLVYRALMDDLLEELAAEEADPIESVVDEEDEDDTLAELEVLEELVEEAEDDGRWLDHIENLDEKLPSNYHNTTEHRTKLADEDIDVKQTIDKSTSDNGESTWISDVMQSIPEEREDGEEERFACSLAQPCKNGEYCFETQFNSKCMECQEVGTRCIDDAQCCSNADHISLCVRGFCAADVRPGSVDTICEVPDDCQPGLCCARVKEYPQRMCRPLATLDQRCSPQLDILSEVLVLHPNDYFCPCESGLICLEKQSMVFNVIPLKYSEGLFCTKVSEERTAAGRRPGLRNLGGGVEPPFGEGNRNVLDPRWQARFETEDDQRFENPSSSDRHRTSKKAMEFNPDDDFMM